MAASAFSPPLRLAGDVSVRTVDEAADFVRKYVGAKIPRRRRTILARLEGVYDPEGEHIAANAFRAWAEAEGLLRE